MPSLNDNPIITEHCPSQTYYNPNWIRQFVHGDVVAHWVHPCLYCTDGITGPVGIEAILLVIVYD